MAESVRALLTNLLSAYGYNLYEGKNRARADDILVREKTAGNLSDAASALRALRIAYQKRFVPPPSRENPSPPAERMAAMRSMGTIQEQLGDLESRIRGMSVPTQDRVWEKLRNERNLLNQLILQDYNLLAPASTLLERCVALKPADWSDDVEGGLGELIDQIESAARQRATLLQGSL